MRPFSIVICGLSAAAGCLLSLDTNTQTIAIVEPNELGVVTVEVEHYSAEGNDVFALRAFTADSQERAYVQLTRGSISGLSKILPGDNDVGAEVLVFVDGVGSHMVTRDLERYPLDPGALASPAVERFLAIPEIASTLDQQANISLAVSPPGAEQPFLYTSACPPAYLNTTPLAEECCLGAAGPSPPGLAVVFHAANQSVILKRRNTWSQPACKAADGSNSCNGAACYFGPNGFARPQVYLATNTYAFIYDGSGSDFGGCGVAWYATDPAPHFSNVTGTFPMMQGCPGGDTGAGQWDY